MKYLLDTNVCIMFLSRRNPQLSTRFASIPAYDKTVCSIVRTELYFGAYKSKYQTQSLATINGFLAHLPSLPFDDKAAQICGEIRADLARKGTPIGPYDVQIAAIALANHLTLVTHNTREFSRVPNLLLDDWE